MAAKKAKRKAVKIAKKAAKKRRGKAVPIRPSARRMRKGHSVREALQNQGRAAVATLRALGYTASYRTFLYAGAVRATLDVKLLPRDGTDRDSLALEGAMAFPERMLLEQMLAHVGDPEGPDYQDAERALNKVARALKPRTRRKVCTAAASRKRYRLKAALATLPHPESIPDTWSMVGTRLDVTSADGLPTGSPTIDRGSDTVWSHATTQAPMAHEVNRKILENSLLFLQREGAYVAQGEMVARRVWNYDRSKPATPKR